MVEILSDIQSIQVDSMVARLGLYVYIARFWDTGDGFQHLRSAGFFCSMSQRSKLFDSIDASKIGL